MSSTQAHIGIIQIPLVLILSSMKVRPYKQALSVCFHRVSSRSPRYNPEPHGAHSQPDGESSVLASGELTPCSTFWAHGLPLGCLLCGWLECPSEHCCWYLPLWFMLCCLYPRQRAQGSGLVPVALLPVTLTSLWLQMDEQIWARSSTSESEFFQTCLRTDPTKTSGLALRSGSWPFMLPAVVHTCCYHGTCYTTPN